MGASIIKRVLDEIVVMRLGYSKATVVCQQMAIRRFVVGCVHLYCPVFPDLELAVLLIVRNFSANYALCVALH